MKKVLILDNDHSILEVMHDALNYEGFDVKAIADTENIFSQIDDYKPDVILIDFILNGINGGEICHQVKANQNTSQLPVILMSAYPRVLQSLGDYGCNKFIPKPFDLFNLVNSIRELVA